MRVCDYLNAKYGGRGTTMLYIEAKAFGIPYPLPHGWIETYGQKEITYDMADRLKAALEKSDKPTAAHGLSVLKRAWIELKQSPDVTNKEFLSSKAWKRLRYQALIRYGRSCKLCGARPDDGAVLNVDHIMPRLLYPELALNLDNLQVLCSECNEGKGNWDMTEAKSI